MQYSAHTAIDEIYEIYQKIKINSNINISKINIYSTIYIVYTVEI